MIKIRDYINYVIYGKGCLFQAIPKISDFIKKRNIIYFCSKKTVSPGVNGGVENNIISTGVSPILSKL